MRTDDNVAVDTGCNATSQSGWDCAKWPTRTPANPSESALRGRAKRQGYSLVKIREGSRWYRDYGPFMISNMDNRIVTYGLDLEEAANWLNNCGAVEN